MKPETYKALLKDLQKLQKTLVASQIAAVRSDPVLSARFARLHTEAEVGGRSDDFVATAARKSTVLFLLRTVFVRVLEDLGILGLKRIRGDWGFAAFREVAPALDHRAYLAFVFRDLAVDFPALFAPGDDELPLPDEDGCVSLWELWHHPNREGEHYVWNGEGFDSRFLGDLYQDLDADIRKRYALLQTPPFVEQFILDHTLTPALAQFDPGELRSKGQVFRLIDPTCGSGHFLIGAFHRLADHWRNGGLSEWDACARALESIWGCDINPHAVDIAAFRLLLEVVARTRVRTLDQLATLQLNLRTLDSLIPWERGARQGDLFPAKDRLDAYASEDQRRDNASFLRPEFHAVVGNPPYVQPLDPAKRDDYREFWPISIQGRYSLSAPFVERFFSLAAQDAPIGMINSNAFATRKFGKPLIEKVLSSHTIRFVVDSQGANIPHHAGVPTLILIAINRAPAPDESGTLVVARRASVPDGPEGDLDPVWRSMREASNAALVGEPFQDENVEAKRLSSAEFAKHPWTLAPLESTELLSHIESVPGRLHTLVEYIGFNTITSATDLLHLEGNEPERFHIEGKILREFIDGAAVRDYSVTATQRYPAPYSEQLDLLPLADYPALKRFIWPHRSWLSARFVSGGTTMHDVGLPYHAIPQFSKKKVGRGIALVYAQVATCQHVALADSSNLFAQTSPVIRLKGDVPREHYFDLLGLLSSSVAEFWVRNRCHNRRKLEQPFEDYYERAAERLANFPTTEKGNKERAALAQALDEAGRARAACLPDVVLASWSGENLQGLLDDARKSHVALTGRMVALQEELDWLTYGAYGVIPGVSTVAPHDVEPLTAGHRPFEIFLAQREADVDDDERSTWWVRLGHNRVPEFPDGYSDEQRARLEHRLQVIRTNSRVALLESPPFKRRWQQVDWDAECKRTAHTWLLDRLEGLFSTHGDRGQSPLAVPKPYSLEEIVAAWIRDPRVASVAGVWTGTGESVDLTRVAEQLINENAIPDNHLRLYSPDGLRKLQVWKQVWARQDQEDAREVSVADAKARGDDPPKHNARDQQEISDPPKYGKNDFVKGEFFAIRGRRNVARERFILFADLTPVRYGWNGWQNRERALAQVEAYTLAENHPHQPLPIPTTDDPRRCGVTLGLWESLEDVKRWNSLDEHAELKSLAQEACRQSRCPCPVVEAWKSRVLEGRASEDASVATSSRRNGKGKGASRAKAPAVSDAVQEAIERTVSLQERAWIAGLFDGAKEFDFAGLWALHQRRVNPGEGANSLGGGQLRMVQLDGTLPEEARALDEARMTTVIDDLVASGDLAVRGRGKKKRYQLVPRATRA